VLFRHTPSSNYLSIAAYYFLWINPNDGTYGVLKWQGAWTTLKGATSASAILRGGATNQIRVECVGSQIKVYANGSLLATMTNSSLTGGWIALAASGSGMHAHFDNAKVWRAP
jgi:hypothetical protein